MQQLRRSMVRRAEPSREAKLGIYRAVYVPVLTYGHQVWVMTERTRSRIRAAEMRFLRAVAGVTRIDRCRNAAIREGLQVEPVTPGSLQEIAEDRAVWRSLVASLTPRP
ncbi:UNVERIFIED_CONTAM: hypothetical protein PYX00_008851 [Menopon gallinae]|uniref:Uncharacterized protein n=1 Tax=Menopon gallinae TaxID=328185 RepID=A0AAW2H972_9NEOP